MLGYLGEQYHDELTLNPVLEITRLLLPAILWVNTVLSEVEGKH